MAACRTRRRALGLPAVYDEETFAIIRGKLKRMHEVLGCPLLLETPSIFTPIPDMEMTEPEFLNRLWKEEGCGTLVDMHNLYVSWRNGGMNPRDYLGADRSGRRNGNPYGGWR